MAELRKNAIFMFYAQIVSHVIGRHYLALSRLTILLAILLMLIRMIWLLQQLNAYRTAFKQRKRELIIFTMPSLNRVLSIFLIVGRFALYYQTTT